MSRNAFTEDVEANMWEFISRMLKAGDERAKKPSGLKIWGAFRQVQERRGNSCTSAQSLSTHFRKQMLPSICNVGLPRDDVLLMCQRWRLRLSDAAVLTIQRRFNCKVVFDESEIVSEFVQCGSDEIGNVSGRQKREEYKDAWLLSKKRKPLTRVECSSARCGTLVESRSPRESEIAGDAPQTPENSSGIPSYKRLVEVVQIDDDGVIFKPKPPDTTPVSAINEMEQNEMIKAQLEEFATAEAVAALMPRSVVRLQMDEYLRDKMINHVSTVRRMLASPISGQRIRFELGSIPESRVSLQSRIKMASQIRDALHSFCDVFAESGCRMFEKIENDAAICSKDNESYERLMQSIIHIVSSKCTSS
ncbi:unnamed protein product [Caenorhabditis auriculariae]|uniref:SPK domain-containing protein n=1 Tax=Caenorhabditis auriculariae TaxID=2777116 RepID=A0A8S1GN61_9PELO|nr:unnamed protein product [Caenorhabditis auriculariae]